MGKTVITLKTQYDNLSKGEKKIADFILRDPAAAVSLYITDLAQKCGASEATIVRFCKKLGFDGYQGLKLALASEGETRNLSENISPSDSAADIFRKICDDIYCSLEKTKKALSPEALEKCCEAIAKADKILIFGLGNSASVAVDAAHKLLRLGLDAHAYTDNHMQAIAAAHTTAKSVVIGVSHSGKSKDVVDAMRLAQARGATTVAMTNHSKSPIDSASDLILETVADETNYRILGLSSRIAQLAIVDAIYSCLVCRLKGADERIAETESALSQKKY